MRFIHTADLHLDAPVGALSQRAAIRRSGLETLQEMIDYAKEQGISQVVIAGDLFDAPSPSAAMAGAVQAMLSAAGDILFLIAPGNHDPLPLQGAWCGMTLPENVHLFSKECETVSVAGGSFVGAGFYEGMTGHPLKNLPEKTGVTVGVFHGSVGDSEPMYRIEEQQVKNSGLDYLALGHIHKAADPRQIGKTVVAHCGSPTAHGFDETGRRSFLDVTIGENRVSCVRIYTGGICFYEDVISLEEQDEQSDILGKLMAAAAAHGPKDIYRFRLIGTTAHALPTALEEYPALVEIIDETSLPVSLEKLAAEQSLRGFFVSGMLEKIQNAAAEERPLYEAALRLGLEAFE